MSDVEIDSTLDGGPPMDERVAVLVRATVQATVDEEWTLALTVEQAARLRADTSIFEELVGSETEGVLVLGVENVQVRNEEDREVVSVAAIEQEAR